MQPVFGIELPSCLQVFQRFFDCGTWLSRTYTSRYFSADFGLLYLVALDPNLYYHTDPCGAPWQRNWRAWL